MCEKCQDRGFTEEEHGLIRVLCDCDKAREVAEIAGIPWREEAPLKAEIITVDPMAAKALTETFESMGELDGISSGTERDNQPAGSSDTGKPKQQKKPRAKKKTGKRAG